MTVYKKDTCPTCGQRIDEEAYYKHLIKNLKRDGLPSLAKLLKIARSKESR